MGKKKDFIYVASIVAVVGVVLLAGFLLYYYWRDRLLNRKQDAQTASIAQAVDNTNTLFERLRVLELAQCNDPVTKTNANLRKLLKCPPETTKPKTSPAASSDFRSTITTAPAAFHAANSQQKPIYTLPRQQSESASTYYAQDPTPRFSPPLPNYGFFGSGPMAYNSQ